MKPEYSLLGQNEDLPSTDVPFSTSLGDMFSTFSRHIGPAPAHERPERTVQMRLYTLQKRHFLLIFLIFFSLFCISVLIGLSSPKMIEENIQLGTNVSGAKIPQGPFLIRSPRLSRYNQQVWMSLRVLIENKEKEAFNKNFTVLLSVRGLSAVSKQAEPVGKLWHNRTRNIECSEAQCKDLIALHLGYLSYNMYLVNISLAGLKHIHESYKIKDILFIWSSINPAFTQLEVVFRFFFLLLSFLVFLVFGSQIKKYPLTDWSMEQRWICLLLLLLALYNNPLFPLTFTSLTLLSGILDAIFQSTFLFSLLLFWLCAIHGLRQTHRNLKFYLPKLVLVFTMWLAALTMEVTQEVNQVRDPTYSYQINSSHYTRFQTLFILLLFIYVLYAIFLVVKAFTELRSMQFIQTRLRFITGFIVIIVTLSTGIVYTKFGTGILEDNFISRMYTSQNSIIQFVASYAVLNLYVYMMAYMYSPCGQAIPSNNIMMGESDEEVLYGDSEARKPLNSAIEDEDSD